VLLNGVHCKKQAKNGVAKASFDRPKLKHFADDEKVERLTG